MSKKKFKKFNSKALYLTLMNPCMLFVVWNGQEVEKDRRKLCKVLH